MTSILAFDQSTTATGWALLSDNAVERVGMIAGDDAPRMAHAIAELMRATAPDAVAFEGVYAGRNIKVHGMLSELLGACKFAAEMRNVPWAVVNTAQIDAACDLHYPKGKRKDATAAFAHLVYGDVPEHVADAICVGWAARGEYWRSMIDG